MTVLSNQNSKAKTPPSLSGKMASQNQMAGTDGGDHNHNNAAHGESQMMKKITIMKEFMIRKIISMLLCIMNSRLIGGLFFRLFLGVCPTSFASGLFFPDSAYQAFRNYCPFPLVNLMYTTYVLVQVCDIKEWLIIR